jgi:hypothetical protein
VPDVPPGWTRAFGDFSNRRRRERRGRDRRQQRGNGIAVERRSSRKRRARQRRESAAGHLRNALQVLVHLPTGRTLDPELDADLTAAIRRVWLALLEVETPNDHH